MSTESEQFNRDPNGPSHRGLSPRLAAKLTAEKVAQRQTSLLPPKPCEQPPMRPSRRLGPPRT